MSRLVIVLLACAACVSAPVSMGSSLPKETAADCTKHCASIDMRMSAVVIIANSTGCVCEPRDSKGSAPRAATAAAGGAIIAQQKSQTSAQPTARH